MNPGSANRRECNPPVSGAASKRPFEDSEEEPPRERRRASSASSKGDASRTDVNPLRHELPLHHAALQGDLDRVRELIKNGADARLQDKWGRTPLHWALASRKEAAADLLLEAGGGNDVQDEDDQTPLHLAACNGYGVVKTIRKLLAGGSRTRVQDFRGRTPLHCALWEALEAAAELLAEADCCQEVRDGDGKTPLYLATLMGYQGVVRKIIQSGTNPHVEDSSGEYPIQLALMMMRDDNIPKMIISSYALRGMDIDWEKLKLEEEDLQFCIAELSRCDAEIRLMGRTRVPSSSVTYLDLVTRHVTRVASRLPIEGVPGVSRSGPARRKFPVYGDLIVSKLRAAGERRVRTDGCRECFSLLSTPLPSTGTDIVVLCLSNDDLENFVRAVRLEVGAAVAPGDGPA